MDHFPLPNFPSFYEIKQAWILMIDNENFSVWWHFFKILRATRNCPSSAWWANKSIDFLVGLLPYLRPSSFEMGHKVSIVIKLISMQSIVFFGYPFGRMIIMVLIVESNGGAHYYLSSKSFHICNLLLGYVIWKAYLALVAFDWSYHSQRNSSVSRSTFYDHPPWFDLIFLFCIFYNPKSSSIFDAPAWIHMLTFDHDLASSDPR